MKPCKFLILLVFLSGIFSARPAMAGERFTIKGSDTLGTILFPGFLEAWKQAYPDVQFETYAEGSGTGIEALLLAQTDLAFSSRRARQNEFSLARAKDVVLQPYMICEDGIAVIVAADSPLAGLSLRQVRELFAGIIRDWSELGLPKGEVELYTRNPTSGTYLDFQTIAMNRRAYARSVKMLTGNIPIVDAVAKDPRGIGYVSMAYAQQDPRVKILPIDDILPSAETVHDHSYPITRPNFVYTDGKPAGFTREIVDFILSDEGQEIIRKAGFVPLD